MGLWVRAASSTLACCGWVGQGAVCPEKILQVCLGEGVSGVGCQEQLGVAGLGEEEGEDPLKLEGGAKACLCEERKPWMWPLD